MLIYYRSHGKVHAQRALLASQYKVFDRFTFYASFEIKMLAKSLGRTFSSKLSVCCDSQGTKGNLAPLREDFATWKGRVRRVECQVPLPNHCPEKAPHLRGCGFPNLRPQILRMNTKI